MRASAAIIWALAACSVCASSAGQAAPMRRFALLVGNNEGGPDTARLRYAEADAKKVREVLEELGGYRQGDVVTLLGGAASDVMRSIERLEAQVSKARGDGARTSLLVYYSGHAKVGDLRLGDTRLDMTWLRERLKHSAADVKIGILDACESGAITRTKGGRRGPSFLFDVDDTEATRGLILISSSAQDESSQESDEIGGSFFTHYLTSGLRGAADDSKDQRVTLGEVYEYTYHKTVSVTASTRSGVQHPTYSYDLQGQGDIVLTDLSQGRTGLFFGRQLEGRFLVFDLGREQVAAEIDKQAGSPRRLALPPGQYALKKRMPDHLRMTRFELLDRQLYPVDEAKMAKVAFEDDYAKGVALRTRVGPTRTRLSLEAIGAYQVFLSKDAREQLFPALPLFGVTSRIGPVLGGAHLQVDLLFGGRGAVPLQIDRFELRQDFFETQVGLGLLWRGGLGPFVFGAGPRLSAMYMRRSFPGDSQLESAIQDMLALSPAVGLEAQTFFGADDAFTFGLTGRGGVLLYNVDDNRTLAYLEAGLFLGYRP